PVRAEQRAGLAVPPQAGLAERGARDALALLSLGGGALGALDREPGLRAAKAQPRVLLLARPVAPVARAQPLRPATAEAAALEDLLRALLGLVREEAEPGV